MLNYNSWLLMHIIPVLLRGGSITFMAEGTTPTGKEVTKKYCAAYSSAEGFEGAHTYSGRIPEVRVLLDHDKTNDEHELTRWDPSQYNGTPQWSTIFAQVDQILTDIGNRICDEELTGDILICANAGLITALMRKLIFELLPREHYEHLEAVTSESCVTLYMQGEFPAVDRLVTISAAA